MILIFFLFGLEFSHRFHNYVTPKMKHKIKVESITKPLKKNHIYGVSQIFKNK